MLNLIRLIASLSPSKQAQQSRIETYRNLIRKEAKIGGQLFGPVPPNGRREFFCLDTKTWVWHEEWTDGEGVHTLTTRYDVRPDGVLKAQDGRPYQYIGYDEAKRLYQAVDLYSKRVDSEIYSSVA